MREMEIKKFKLLKMGKTDETRDGGGDTVTDLNSPRHPILYLTGHFFH